MHLTVEILPSSVPVGISSQAPAGTEISPIITARPIPPTRASIRTTCVVNLRINTCLKGVWRVPGRKAREPQGSSN